MFKRKIVAMGLLGLLYCGALQAASELVPTQLRCEYIANPLGIDESKPRLRSLVRLAEMLPDAVTPQVNCATFHRGLMVSLRDATLRRGPYVQICLSSERY
jgi:hypothetical protein